LISASITALQKLYNKVTRWEIVPTKFSTPSAEYHGELTKTGKTVEILVAHDLESGKADRFVVVVDMKNLERGDHYAWELDTELVTNVGIASGPRVSI